MPAPAHGRIHYLLPTLPDPAFSQEKDWISEPHDAKEKTSCRLSPTHKQLCPGQLKAFRAITLSGLGGVMFLNL